MKHLALGWACNLNNLFINFPFDKIKSIKLLSQKRKIIKNVFREGVKIILNDIIDNNNTFKIPSMRYYGGEIHFEAIQDSEFEAARKNGKFKDVDFLESLFTGYQLYLYLHSKRDDFLHRRKFPIYISKFYKDKITKNTNEGKTYC